MHRFPDLKGAGRPAGGTATINLITLGEKSS
jgi:hypothetical protein